MVLRRDTADLLHHRTDFEAGADQSPDHAPKVEALIEGGRRRRGPHHHRVRIARPDAGVRSPVTEYASTSRIGPPFASPDWTWRKLPASRPADHALPQHAPDLPYHDGGRCGAAASGAGRGAGGLAGRLSRAGPADAQRLAT